MLLLPQTREALGVCVGELLENHERKRGLCDSFISTCAVLVTASLAHALFLVVAIHISPFNTTWSSSSPTVNDSVFSSTMEAVRTGCSKGIFSLGRYLGDSDVLFQFLTHHKLVSASRKCPKCASEITINNNYFCRCDRQRIRGASTVSYSLPTSRTPIPTPTI